MFSDAFIDSVNSTNLVSVSAGPDRTKPLEIWVVAVGHRLFARSWGLSERSWYTAFLNGSAGCLECKGRRVAVTGRKPPDLEILTPLIDAEYLRKYDRGDNSKYAHGILAEKHAQRTLEFIPAIIERTSNDAA